MAPSRPYDGCHGAGDGPPPQRAAQGKGGSGGRATLRATVTVGYVAAPVPLLSTPSLADTMADQVDDRAVQLLLKLALTKQKSEEEREERRRQEEVAEHERAYARLGPQGCG